MGVRRVTSALALCSAGLFGQYTAERTGPPPVQLAARIAQLMQKDGFKVSHQGQPYCEIWFRAEQPSGRAQPEVNVTLASIAPGTLVGVINFDDRGADRRGQPIAAGIYTLRYAVMPRNEAHLGAARQRDFLVMSRAADDQDPNATPNFEALMKMSAKASLTPHPAVLSLRKADADAPGFSQRGDDWILQTRLGETPIEVILIGSANP